MFECPRCHTKLRPGVTKCPECNFDNPLKTVNTWLYPALIVGCFALIFLWMRISSGGTRADNPAFGNATIYGRPIIDLSDVTATHDQTIQAQSQVQGLMQKVFGSRLRNVNVLAEPSGGYSVGVRFILGNDQDANSAKTSIETDMTNAYKTLYMAPLDIRLVSLYSLGMVQNQQQNHFVATVYATSLTSTGADAIDWYHVTNAKVMQNWHVIVLNPVLGTVPPNTDDDSQ